MKLKRYIKLFITPLVLVSLASCSEDIIEGSNDTFMPAEGESDELVDVKIAFKLEDLLSEGTRGDEVTEAEKKFGLKHIDLLVYAVRDEKGNIMTQYGRGLISETLKDSEAVKNFYDDQTNDNHQTLMKVDWIEKPDGHFEMDTITLRVMRGTSFNLSVWAQNSGHAAYDFSDLTNLKIDYSKVNQNDNRFEAFCTSSLFSVGQVSSTITVTLTRPFAQVNVGIKKGFEAQYADYKYSKIKISGAETSFNVVENRVNSTETSKTTVDFNFESLPVNDNGDPSYFEVSEWIKVPKKENKDEYEVKLEKTEYQYLSFCYVLVPESSFNMDDEGNKEDQATSDKTPDGTGSEENSDSGLIAPSQTDSSIVLEYFALSTDENGEPKEGKGLVEKDYTPKDGSKEFSIKVKRNWRTNLLFNSWEELN